MTDKSRQNYTAISALCGLLMMLLPVVFGLSACEGTKKQMGLGRQTPDEFAIIKQGPLTLPPDYSLRPPRPGASRPQDKTASEKAFAALSDGQTPSLDNFGNVAKDLSDAEITLLQQAGAHKSRPGIRRLVDEEAKLMKRKEQPVGRRLLGLDTGPAEAESSVVDAPAEYQRIKENMDNGRDVTEGATPSLETE